MSLGHKSKAQRQQEAIERKKLTLDEAEKKFHAVLSWAAGVDGDLKAHAGTRVDQEKENSFSCTLSVVSLVSWLKA